MAINDVKVVISLTKASPKAGFGFPLILAGGYTSEVAYKEVTSLEEIVTAGFEATSDVYKAASLMLAQSNAPTKIAVAASTSATVEALPNLLNKDWRQLVVVGGEDDSTVAEISEYIESCGKNCLYFAGVDSSFAISTIAENERTILVASENTDFIEAAVVGATAGLEVGSFTYKNIILTGVEPETYTATEVETLHEKGIITVLRKAGSVVTSEGIVVGGEYIDIVDCRDYIVEQIEYQSQALMNRVPKLHFDNRGISSLESVVVSVLKDACEKGMVAQNDSGDYVYSVTFAPRSDCDPADISARMYNKGQFSFELAGAIHNAKVAGEIIA